MLTDFHEEMVALAKRYGSARPPERRQAEMRLIKRLRDDRVAAEQRNGYQMTDDPERQAQLMAESEARQREQRQRIRRGQF
ncbi:MAG: hypothetical protein AAGK37_21875 [Pseudomonadota bacterium]